MLKADQYKVVFTLADWLVVINYLCVVHSLTELINIYESLSLYCDPLSCLCSFPEIVFCYRTLLVVKDLFVILSLK